MNALKAIQSLNSAMIKIKELNLKDNLSFSDRILTFNDPNFKLLIYKGLLNDTSSKILFQPKLAFNNNQKNFFLQL
ncbi:hypothetical protein BpHYR1_050489 [Brachionus plicatilis]|uniref:Uncharacterized protein n=1 Tax=Brachionus plicatilis TaxID=10195 RepID=A0A3M7T2B1_BRAPC|nr:hypothetical protein BpHYR1_050489 [Brachionus plicatilis]